MASTDQIYYRLEALPALDWDDFPATGEMTRELLKEIGGNRAHLSELVQRARSDPKLFAMAEHFERIDRLVLYDDLSRGVRIRLHIYPAKHFDGPHDHRWSFSSFVIHGGYRHSMFSGTLDEGASMTELAPDCVRDEGVGASYTLHHKVVHAVIAQPGSVSLILRGPAEKERLIMTDLRTGRMRWKYGVQRETLAELESRKFTRERFDNVVQHLASCGLT